MNFKLWLEQDSQVLQTLMALRPQMAAAAQQVYDNWDQSDEYDEYNGGGICQDIAEAIADVIHQQFPGEVDAGTVSAACGEQHVWCILAVGDEGYEIDIPYSMYERGGGYTWEKIQGVQFKPNDIVIAPMNAQDARDALEHPW